MKYLEGMKYVLSEDYIVKTPVTGQTIFDTWFALTPDGNMMIKAGFAWDGASGPTWDTKSCLSASAVHDVFCILMRDGRLSYDRWQDTVNEFFRDQCIANGMPAWRAKLWFMGVEFGNAGDPKQGPDRQVKEAP